MSATTIPVQYSLMAGSAYFSTRGDVNRIPFSDSDGWQRLSGYNFRQDDTTGFEAAAFIKGNEIAISYAGTYAPQSADLIADAVLGLGGLSPQLLQAAMYYEDVKRAYPTAKISFTGHSLGGGLAALMGVFFNKAAITFDPAPFRAAANMTNAVALDLYLLANGYGVDADLLSFFSMPVLGKSFIRGESRIQAISVDGEFLTSYGNKLRIAGSNRYITHGAGNLDPTNELHSQALLIAMEQSSNFVEATKQMSFFGKDIFDPGLFAKPTDQDSPDLITHLIRREFGVPGVAGSDTDLLTKFSADAIRLGRFASVGEAAIRPLLKLAL